MLTNNPTEPQAVPSVDAKAGAAEAPVAVLNPGDVIEVASDGTGTVNDPGASDTRPPGISDLEMLA